jgi:hypothetical protein
LCVSNAVVNLRFVTRATGRQSARHQRRKHTLRYAKACARHVARMQRIGYAEECNRRPVVAIAPARHLDRV